MANINPRARGGNSLSETLAARRKREEQLGRQRVVIPKPKPPVAPVAAGGGIVGVAEVQADPASLFLSDLGGLDKYRVQFGAATETRPGALPVSATSFCDVSGNVIFLTVGTYSISCRVDFAWSGGVAPAYVQCGVTINGHPTDFMHLGADTSVPVMDNGSGMKGISTVLNFGPTVVINGDDFVWLETSAGSAPQAGEPASGFNFQPMLHFTISKWS